MNTELSNRLALLNDVLCAVNVLQWDARVMMPAGGATTRGHQIATLKGIARNMILDPAMADAADSAMAETKDETERRAAQAVLAARDWHTAIPPDLLRRQAEKSAVAGAAWVEARRREDFTIFQPHLQDIVELARQMAAATGFGTHPYDPMVHIFEPGENAASLGLFFDRLRDGLRPILDTALGRPKPRTDFLYRHYPMEEQKAFCWEIAQALGYDMSRGRLDTAVHPFEISFTRQDVRITSRWNEDYLPMSIFGTIHETGHALYEMGVDPMLTRTAHTTDMIGLYAVGGSSFGMHESQSRLLENHVGRAPAFWATHFGRLRDHFPAQLGDVDEAEFIAAINRVEPSLIRVEADELTYDFHIMLRVRLEMALIEGSLSVADIPGAWNDAMRDDLGLEVPSDAMGCLQDVHWSSGYIGSFPTYTIGNATAAQIMHQIGTNHPEVTDALNAGDTAPLRDALQELVWRHGRSRNRTEVLAPIGEEASDPSTYLSYLRSKFAS